MSDYFHYAYQCPYLSGTDAKTVYCDGRCRIGFDTLAETRKWLLRYCADSDGWKNCTLAKQKVAYQEWKLSLQKEVKSWKTTRKRK